jgi:hypothetical protein
VVTLSKPDQAASALVRSRPPVTHPQAVRLNAPRFLSRVRGYPYSATPATFSVPGSHPSKGTTTVNTRLAPIPRRDHPPQPGRVVAPHPVRRVGVLDRAAMHLGVALIHWGRRPVKPRRRERPVLAPETLAARRELDRLRDQHLALRLTQFR